MQSIRHTVYNVEQTKIALSFADDKRAWHADNFSLPYGHISNTFPELLPTLYPAEFQTFNDDNNIMVQSDAQIYDELFGTPRHNINSDNNAVSQLQRNLVSVTKRRKLH